jgi:small GTP-binding protein
MTEKNSCYRIVIPQNRALQKKLLSKSDRLTLFLSLDHRMLGHRFDYSLKIVVVGDAGVGKTCLLLRFVRDEWDPDTQSTLGVEFLAKVVNTDNHRIQLQLWDTAGQEIFRAVTRGYYRGSAGALIVFSLASRDSFANIDSWLKDLRDIARQDITALLIGNKSDLADKRQVTHEEALAYAEKNGLLYFETSALSGEGVSAAIAGCVVEIEKKVDAGLISLTPSVEPVAFNATAAPSGGCGCEIL